MDLLDNLEEYTKLISSVGLSKGSAADSESKINDLSDKVEKLKESHEMHKNDVDSRISQMCIDLELQKKDHNSLSESSVSVKLNSEALLKEVNELKEYRQSMEEYKKVTDGRIEKLVKLFLSINK